MTAPTATRITTDDALDELTTAHTRIVDAIEGYRTMLDKAAPSFRPTIERLLATHDRHRVELAALLTRNNRAPDADGSFMSSVHRTVVKARALFGEIDDDAAAQIASGEKWILSAYKEALEEGLAEGDAAVVARHRATLSQSVADLQRMDD